MLVAHLLAAFGLACWLSLGENLLWRAAQGAAAAVRRAAGRLRRRDGRVLLLVPDPVTRLPARRRIRRPVLLHYIVIRRGPPVHGML